MSYTTHWEEDGVCWHLSGIITAQEIFEFTNAFYDNPKSDSVNYQIVDCLDADKYVLDDETMAEVAALDYAASLSIRHMKVALICVAPDIIKVNQEYIEYSRKFRSNWDVKIFDNMKTARQWISE